MHRFIYYTKYIGLFLVLVSGSFLSAFSIHRYSERQQQLKLIEEFEATMLERNKDIHDGQEYLGATTENKVYLTNETFAILELKELDIKVSVVEGVDKDALKLSAGHFPNSSYPGEGNFAIAGHSSFVYTCLFNNLHKAEVGNILTVKTRDKDLTYEITDIFITEPTDLSVLDPSEESILTIVTCTKDGTERLIIRAKQIG